MTKSKLDTAIDFAKNLFTTGAVFQTSRKTEREICTRLSREPRKIFVEFGMGHGNITRQVLKTIAPDAKLYTFEINPEFCEYVARTLRDDRLVIVNDGAENLLKHLEGQRVAGFVSSIPFTFFAKEKRLAILRQTYDVLEPGGVFSQVLYSKFHYKIFDQVFDEADVRKISTIPLEYIYHCRKRK
ncbi:MAG: methyltransferase domain-containing protein [Bacteroidetes bacterium]|nr:MAG: methyltransferase domain-containing protein [Bacteroidota bacterium]